MGVPGVGEAGGQHRPRPRLLASPRRPLQGRPGRRGRGLSHGQAVGKQKTSWQAEATANAVAAARSIAQSQLANTPAGRLSDQQWGWIISAAIFAWIRTSLSASGRSKVSQKEAARHPDGSVAL